MLFSLLRAMEETADPAAFLTFDSHNHASAVLEQVGFRECKTTLNFSSAQLCERVNQLVETEGLVCMDMTSTLPETPCAAYQALAVAGFTAASACRKDENAAFVVVRTEANTPSYLFGVHWSTVQALGKDVADAQIRRNPTPFLVVFFQDRHFQVPTSVACAGVDVTARLVAHELTKNTVFLCCSLCGTSFVKRGEHGFVTLDEMGVAPGGKFFHRECVEKYVAEGTV